MIDNIVFSDPAELPNEEPDEVIEYDSMDELDDSDVDIEIVCDVTGTPLCPGHPKICLGSGNFSGFECSCDECDYYIKCFPEWAPGGSAWKEDNKNAEH